MTVEAVDHALDDVRPYLIADGGNVEVLAVENGRVFLQLQVRTPCFESVFALHHTAALFWCLWPIWIRASLALGLWWSFLLLSRPTCGSKQAAAATRTAAWPSPAASHSNHAAVARCCVQGACGTCAASSATMKMGIERCLKAAFGEQLVEVLQVGRRVAEGSTRLGVARLAGMSGEASSA